MAPCERLTDLMDRLGLSEPGRETLADMRDRLLLVVCDHGCEGLSWLNRLVRSASQMLGIRDTRSERIGESRRWPLR